MRFLTKCQQHPYFLNKLKIKEGGGGVDFYSQILQEGLTLRSLYMWCPNPAGLSIQPNPTSLKVINKHTIIFYLFQNEEGEGGGGKLRNMNCL